MIIAWKICGVAASLFAAGAITGGLVSARLGLGQRHPLPTVAPAAAAPTGTLEQNAERNPPVPSLPPDNRRKDRSANGPRPPGVQRMEVLRHLEDSLPLDTAQRERIRSLVQQSDERIRREWDPVYPRIQGELRDLRRRIAAELRPEQRAKLDALLDRRNNRRTSDAAPALR